MFAAVSQASSPGSTLRAFDTRQFGQQGNRTRCPANEKTFWAALDQNDEPAIAKRQGFA
jgi:hypothetical protein